MSKQMKRLDESVLSVADTAYAFRFLKLLITPWEKTSAYKEGLIDKNGKRDKSVKIKTKQQKESYTIFHRLVYNIKRLVGNTKFTSFVSALYLIKEDSDLDDNVLYDALCDGLDEDFFLYDTDAPWFIKEGVLDRGTYKLTGAVASPLTAEVIAHEGDEVFVETHTHPIEEFLGNNIYEVTHKATEQKLYVIAEDIV